MMSDMACCWGADTLNSQQYSNAGVVDAVSISVGHSQPIYLRRGTAPLDLTKGTNSLSQDLDAVLYRMKMLGFNSIRLAFTFDNTWGLGQVHKLCCSACLLARWLARRGVCA